MAGVDPRPLIQADTTSSYRRQGVVDEELLGSRLNGYNTEAVTPIGVVILSVVIALLVSVGATFGGTLVYDYGFNVETAGDSPVWHKSEVDVFPGQHDKTDASS